MRLGVRFYRDVMNPKGIPDFWPAEVLELGDAPVPPGQVLMSMDEYNEYRAQHMPAYLSWENEYLAAQAAAAEGNETP